jgi:hypothetical protein
MNPNPQNWEKNRVGHMLIALEWRNTNCFIYLFVLNHCCTEGTMWHLQKILYNIIVEFTPSTILLYPPCIFCYDSFKWAHWHVCGQRRLKKLGSQLFL